MTLLLEKLTKISTRLEQMCVYSGTSFDIILSQEAEGFYQDEVEQFHSQRNEQLYGSIKQLEPVVSSEEEDYSDEVRALFIKYTRPSTHPKL